MQFAMVEVATNKLDEEEVISRRISFPWTKLDVIREQTIHDNNSMFYPAESSPDEEILSVSEGGEVDVSMSE